MKIIFFILILIVTLSASEENAKQFNSDGEKAYHAGNAERARELFFQAFHEDNRYAPALANLSLSFMKSNEYTRSIFWSDQLLELDSVSPTIAGNALFNQGVCYEKMKEFARARQSYNFAFRKNPTKVYRRSANKLLTVIDSLVAANQLSGSAITLKSRKLIKIPDTTGRYDSLYDFDASMGITDPAKAPFDKPHREPIYNGPYERMQLSPVDFTNDGKIDYLLWSSGGSGHYTSYQFFTQDSTGKWYCVEELSGGGFADHQPTLYQFHGVIYIIDKKMSWTGNGWRHDPELKKVSRYQGNSRAFQHLYKTSKYQTVLDSFALTPLFNESLYNQLVPIPDLTFISKAECDTFIPYPPTADEYGTEGIALRASFSGGMHQFFNYRVILNETLLFEGKTYVPGPELIHSKVHIDNGELFFINFYYSKESTPYLCKIYKYDDGEVKLKSVVGITPHTHREVIE